MPPCCGSLQQLGSLVPVQLSVCAALSILESRKEFLRAKRVRTHLKLMINRVNVLLRILELLHSTSRRNEEV
jgi:hypothetical protein